MVWNRHSSSFGALDGGMGGGESFMTAIEIRRPVANDKRARDLKKDSVMDLGTRGAGLQTYTYGLATRLGWVNRIEGFWEPSWRGVASDIKVPASFIDQAK